MKQTSKILIPITIAATLLCASHTASKPAPDPAEASWRAFCAARLHAPTDTSAEAETEYLDTWRGTVEEEAALRTLGITTTN